MSMLVLYISQRELIKRHLQQRKDAVKAAKEKAASNAPSAINQLLSSPSLVHSPNPSSNYSLIECNFEAKVLSNQQEQMLEQQPLPSLNHPVPSFKTSFESIELSAKMVNQRLNQPRSSSASSASNPSIPQVAGSHDEIHHHPSGVDGASGSETTLKTGTAIVSRPHQEAFQAYSDRAQSLNLRPDASSSGMVGGSADPLMTSTKKGLRGDSIGSLTSASVGGVSASVTPSETRQNISASTDAVLGSESSAVSVEKSPIAKKPSSSSNVAAVAPASASAAVMRATSTSSAEFKPDIASTDHFLASNQQNGNDNNSTSSVSSNHSATGSTPSPLKIHPVSGAMPSTPVMTPIASNSAGSGDGGVTPKQREIKSKSTSKKDKARAIGEDDGAKEGVAEAGEEVELNQEVYEADGEAEGEDGVEGDEEGEIGDDEEADKFGFSGDQSQQLGKEVREEEWDEDWGNRPGVGEIDNGLSNLKELFTEVIQQ